MHDAGLTGCTTFAEARAVQPGDTAWCIATAALVRARGGQALGCSNGSQKEGSWHLAAQQPAPLPQKAKAIHSATHQLQWRNMRRRSIGLKGGIAAPHQQWPATAQQALAIAPHCGRAAPYPASNLPLHAALADSCGPSCHPTPHLIGRRCLLLRSHPHPQGSRPRRRCYPHPRRSTCQWRWRSRS